MRCTWEWADGVKWIALPNVVSLTQSVDGLPDSKREVERILALSCL